MIRETKDERKGERKKMFYDETKEGSQRERERERERGREKHNKLI